MTKRWFIHYFEPGDRLFPGNFGTQIADRARALKKKDGSPLFDHVITYRKADLPLSFIKSHHRHFQHTKGAGYWCWKPYIIKMTLAKMKEGDQLMYSDTGKRLTPKIKHAFKYLKRQDIVPFRGRAVFTDNHWTKMDLAVRLKAVRHMNSTQRNCAVSLYRKSPRSVNIVNQWVRLVKDYDLLTDTPSRAKNHPNFMFHKHDQSIFSLLTKVRGYKDYPSLGLSCTRIVPHRLSAERAATAKRVDAVRRATKKRVAKKRTATEKK